MKNELVTYQWNKENITLTPDDVKKYISTDEKVTDKEVFMFMKLCQAQKLNPFVKEAYLIKYGTKPAQMVVGINTFLKRAEQNKNFDGMETTDSGNIKDGTYQATTKVYRKNLKHPIVVTVDYSEYVGTDSAGNINFMWRTKPKTMTKKVSILQGLRESFPSELGDLYEEVELQQQAEPIDITPEQKKTEIDEDKKLRKEADYVKESREKENKIEKTPADKPTGKKVYPMSPNQRRVMEKNNVPIPENCSYAQAKKLIADSIAKNKKKLSRGNGKEPLIANQEAPPEEGY